MSPQSSWKLNAQFQTTRTLENFWSKTYEKPRRENLLESFFILLISQQIKDKCTAKFQLISSLNSASILVLSPSINQLYETVVFSTVRTLKI